MVLQHVDPFTNLLERPGRLGLACLLRCLPCVPVALARRADAHQLLMGTIAAMAAITAGAHVVDRLKTEKIVTETDKCWYENVNLMPESSVCAHTWSSSRWICSLISWMSESTIFPPWNAGAAKTSSFTGPLKNTHTAVIEHVQSEVYCNMTVDWGG